MHEIPLITTIALALSAALFFGLIARRLGLSSIVGYLIAGVLIGPYTPGVVGDAKIASQLAEIGVILLMFGVGLHFSLKDLLAVRSLAIPGALAQSIAATLACMGLAVAMGWSWQSGLILGIAVSVASTVVMLRALLDHGIVETAEGHVAIGWLVVQDIVTVLVLVLVPAVAAAGGASNIGHTVADRGGEARVVDRNHDARRRAFRSVAALAGSKAALQRAVYTRGFGDGYLRSDGFLPCVRRFHGSRRVPRRYGGGAIESERSGRR